MLMHSNGKQTALQSVQPIRNFASKYLAVKICPFWSSLPHTASLLNKAYTITKPLNHKH